MGWDWKSAVETVTAPIWAPTAVVAEGVGALGGEDWLGLGGDGGGAKSPGSVEQDPATQIDWAAMVEAANQMAEANLARYPRVAAQAGKTTRAYTTQADRYMRNRYYADLGAVLPSWQDTLIGTQARNINQVNTLSDQLITGELPSDLRAQVTRDSQELGLQRGLYGEARTSATARDLGLTSYDLMQTGANMKASQVTPMVQSLTNTTKALLPPTTDPSVIFGRTVSDITGIASTSPTATMQTSAQVAQSNAEMVWAGQVSEMNRQMDIYQTETNKDIANQAAQYQLFGDLIGGAASIFG